LNTFSELLNINENKLYLKLTILFFLIWLASVSPLRSIFQTENIILIILLGSAPNFFAGITFVLWQTYIVSTRLILAFSYSLVLLIVGEFVQLFMDNQTADWWDIIASFFGSLLGALIVWLVEKEN